MLLGNAVAGVLLGAVWFLCVYDVVRADEAEVRGMPKPWWFAVVLLTSLVGWVLWLVNGRPQRPGRA